MSDIANSALQAVQGFFKPGSLQDKIDEIERLRTSGDTMLFDGAVDWSVFLPAAEKRMKGHSESLDDAFADMSALMGVLAAEHGGQEEAQCGLELAA